MRYLATEPTHVAKESPGGPEDPERALTDPSHSFTTEDEHIVSSPVLPPVGIRAKIEVLYTTNRKRHRRVVKGNREENKAKKETYKTLQEKVELSERSQEIQGKSEQK